MMVALIDNRPAQIVQWGLNRYCMYRVILKRLGMLDPWSPPHAFDPVADALLGELDCWVDDLDRRTAMLFVSMLSQYDYGDFPSEREVVSAFVCELEAMKVSPDELAHWTSHHLMLALDTNALGDPEAQEALYQTYAEETFAAILHETRRGVSWV